MYKQIDLGKVDYLLDFQNVRVLALCLQTKLLWKPEIP